MEYLVITQMIASLTWISERSTASIQMRISEIVRLLNELKRYY